MSTKPEKDIKELSSEFERVSKDTLRDGDRDERLRRKPKVEHTAEGSAKITKGYGQD